MKHTHQPHFLPLLAIALLAALCPASLRANAGFFDNSGVGITLGNTDNIQMVSEVVEITFSAADGPVTGDLKHRDKAHYNCRFILKNLSDQTVNAQVGFPLIGEGPIPAPWESPETQEAALEYYQFTAKNGSTAYPVHYQSSDTVKQYRYVFTWEMTFEPNATIELEISYSIYGYIGLGSTERHPPYFNTNYRKDYLQSLQASIVQMYPYVTKTAGSWAGEVQSAQFIIHNADFENYLHKRGALEQDKSKPDTAPRKEPIEQSRSIMENGTLYRHISTGNWQPSVDGKSLTWTEAPFNEHQDFEIRYIFSAMPQSVEGFTKLLTSIETDYNEWRDQMLATLEKMRALPHDDKRQERIVFITTRLNERYPAPFADADRKNVADCVLEFYGIATDNPDITDFLEHQTWYPVTEPRAIDPELKAELLRWHKIGQPQP